MAKQKKIEALKEKKNRVQDIEKSFEDHLWRRTSLGLTLR